MKHETILKIRSTLILSVLFIYPIFFCVSTLDIKKSFLLFMVMAIVSFLIGKILSVSSLTRLLGSREKNEMLNYATSLITPSRLLGNNNTREEILKNSYPRLSEEQIKELVSESFAIFKECEKIPYDENFEKRVSEQYSFLSKSVLGSLQGVAHYFQVK